MTFSIAALLAQDGITNGAIYALLALALVLVFTVTRVIFIPSGEFVTYGTLTLAGLQLGKPPGTVGLLVGLALATGTMFGMFFAIVGLVGPHAGVWPIVGVRFGSLGAGLAVVIATRRSLVLRGPALRWTGMAGVFDIGANMLYLLAVAGGGTLSIIAPIASLYPVSTVMLALGVDRERLRPVQLAGLGFAVTALVLVAT